MKQSEVLAHIQDLEDRLVNRFCFVKRHLERRMPWIDDTAEYAHLEGPVREEIRFYEMRGYYLFQEPWLEHEPFNQRFRVVLTFRPTEGNQ